eukprot:PITA_10390
MFLQETKCSISSMARITKKIRRHINFLEVESKGREGGLVTLWDTREIQILSAEANKHFIAMKAQPTGNSESFLCVNVYGPQKIEDKISFLYSLNKLIIRHPMSKCILGGDFNMITTLLEKKGGLRKLNKDAKSFTSFIENAKLVDIYTKSGNFTWNNRRGGNRMIASRLDRFMISESITMDGILAESDILPSGGSDHWPISLIVVVQGTPRNKPFRFEKFWLEHPNFLQLVENWWLEPLEGKGSKMFNLQKKLRLIKDKIKEWNKTVFGDIFKERTLIEDKLEQIHREWAVGQNNEESIEHEKTLTQQWHSRCRQEEILWRQKSRIQWLKEGEQNTKNFHRSALDYRSSNKILEMRNGNGESVKNHHDISEFLSAHFSSIAQEPQINRGEAIRELLKAIPKVVTSEQNWALSREITLEEVEEAVRSMPNDKAPGPDGFTINFYKACWNIVKQDVWDVVEDSRCSGTILKSINSTFIALIPKVEEANTPEKFRPIALCNVIYKIISKVIANKLKPILPGIISEEQSGYVEGRQILDNIILAQEMIHALHSRKKVGMLMQLDLSKSYDKVSWNYLEAILDAFGFCKHWVNWILALIKSSRFSILVNGAPSEPFSPSRGIRQGDPLSPFLFFILMDGLSRSIAKRKAEGKIKDLQPIPSIPATTHQQFVDDTILHSNPTVKEALAFKGILDLFSRASGMEINFSKSTIFFFNTHHAIQAHLSQLLGFRIGGLPSRYLGAPLTLRPWQKVHWEKIITNMENRCKHWMHRALSFAGRLILTKVVLQAIPQYLLSMLPAPKRILQQIRAIQRSFLWSGNGDKKKSALIAWNKLCKPKHMGGLNLVDPSVVNMTCGAKLWWRWIKEPNLPWARHWKYKYIPNCNHQDLIRLQEQLPKLDTPELSSLKQISQNEGRNRVCHYWDQSSRDANWREWIHLNIDNNIEGNESTKQLNSQILKIKIRKTEEDDQLRWGMIGNGNFSLKEAREMIVKAEQEEVVPWCNKVWDSLFWPKIKTFLWLLMQNKTLTWDNLRRKGFGGPSRCPMCLGEEETINHLFNSCEWANHLWNWLEGILRKSDRDRESIRNTILNWQNNFSKNQRVNNIWKAMPGFLLCTIWKERNRRVFQDEHRNIEHSKVTILTNIKQLIQTKCNVDPNENPSARDLHILRCFQLEASHNITTPRHQQQQNSEVNRWNFPLEGGLKLNFDGDSRGNHGRAGIGGVIRNQEGEIVHIYCRALGEGTNNEMEFAELEQGLRILKSLQNSNVVVEGDSALVISVAKKIQGGTQACKATRHWRLAKVTENIAQLIGEMKGLVFQTVRRKENGLDHYLENYSIDNQDRGWDSCWQQVDSPSLKERCS